MWSSEPADRAGWGDAGGGTHLRGERCQLLLVDGPLIDGVWHGQVHHLTARVREGL